MRILLIQPPMTVFPFEIHSVVPPLGIAYIAAYLEQKGYYAGIIDAIALGWRNPKRSGDMVHLGLTYEEISSRIKEFRPDVIGISSLFSSQFKNAREVAKCAKAYDGDVPVVVGGAHPSSLPLETLKDKNIDIVIIGEGEQSIYEYLKSIDDGKPHDKIDGIAYKDKNGNIKVNPKTRYIEDLDSLPFPARHLLPMDEYFNATGHGSDIMRRPFTSIITSRGCPGNCVFCSIHCVWGYKWRPRSPENVIEEMEFLIKEYGVREIQFEDDTITLDKKRMIMICDLVKEHGLDLKFTTPNGTAVWTLDRELLQKMRDAGFYKLCFAIESGDKETLKFIRKPVNLDKATEVIRIANELGIWTQGFFVFGFPFEKMESIMNSLNFAIESDLDFASFFIATPYPNTPLYEIMKKEGIVGELDWENLRVMNAVSDTKYFKKEELNSLQKSLVSRFMKKRLINYLRPKIFFQRLKRIKSIEDLNFILRKGLRYTQILKKK